ncbi:hypothetical protein LVB87_10505 [Lysobacter sp. KIS68-7]|uniref:hypothetical protein n=1 Tax=Lysobacter sp. KIS68-7 TaxID=2904252 RepID=UPI001E473EFD|nr:hypothetical protein [Lysobacter sp. KIS68-7]UHQ18628.1 hypothetical protein LVB87_10505 [Lysobacter sp. KIS68-7]
MQVEQGSPDAFAQAMLERTQDPSKIAKAKGGMPVEMLAGALVAVVLVALAYAIVG